MKFIIKMLKGCLQLSTFY